LDRVTGQTRLSDIPDTDESWKPVMPGHMDIGAFLDQLDM
jgi:hypothetical protein